MSSMYTQFDVVSLVTILVFMTICMFKGGIKSIIGVLKWYGAFFIALMFYPYTKEIVAGIMQPSPVINAIAVVIVYILAVIFLSLIGAVIVAAFGFGVESIPDRIFGSVVGFVMGYAIISMVHYGLETALTEEERPEWFKNAQTYEFTAFGARHLGGYLQGSMNSMKGDFGVDITDENGKIDKKKVDEFVNSPKVQKLMKDPRVQEMINNDPRIQEMAKKRMESPSGRSPSADEGLSKGEEIGSPLSGNINLESVLKRAAELKDLGYDADEVKSIIEQEQQMGM